MNRNSLRRQLESEGQLSSRLKKENGKGERHDRFVLLLKNLAIVLLLNNLVFCLDNSLNHIPHFHGTLLIKRKLKCLYCFWQNFSGK